ncbi:MAG TPA: heavy metal translocating P-type ATPase [Oligoflexia bacterium]|nr:heavy metal translocating P-type ATPase [Oligoflexia bacterium]HMP27346.1 heavy metal translocating P-type ATPase [Oligoflexia bacterium]
MGKIEISLPLLLPNIPDKKDECVTRLENVLRGKSGIEKVHTVERDGKFLLCLHYNPQIIPLAQVERLAQTAGAQITARFEHGIFSFAKLGSEDAYLSIENELRKIPGVLSASVNTAAQVLRLEWEKTQLNKQAVERLLVEKKLLVPLAKDVASKPFWSRNKELFLSLGGGLFLLLGFLLENFESQRYITITFYLLAYILGAFDLVQHAVKDIKKGQFDFNIDLLMVLAAVGAALLGQWAEGGLLLFLFSMAHALEHYALDKARSAIKALGELVPQKARLRRDGRDEEVPIEDVKANDVVIVLPAERISVDGVVQSGVSAVDQAPITGESVPVEKKAGDQVFAGTVNGNGALEIVTSKASGDRTLDRIIKLVEEAQTQKAPTEVFTEKFERIFVPMVLVVAVLVVVVPPVIGLMSLSESFYRAMALLVGASPCALALGTPSAVLAGIAQAARNGVLIKGGAYLENLGSLRAFAFDKTGTLTIGQPVITEIAPMNGASEAEVLRIAGAVENRSQHPLAKAVVKKAEQMNIKLPDAGEVQSLTAKGVRSVVEGKIVELGSLRLWESEKVTIPDSVRQAVLALQDKGRSVIVIKHGDIWLGVLGVRDTPRDSAKAVLGELRNLGMKPLIMLTGDNKGIGNAVGKEVGVDEVRANLLPEDKVTLLKELLETYGQVAMVGDGVNDAPALAHATVGISMGGAGTAVALETADVALMGDDLSKLPFAVGLSRAAQRIIRQNLYISLFVIGLLVLSTVSGLLGIGIAVIIHEGSTMVVVANSLRLLRFS